MSAPSRIEIPMFPQGKRIAVTTSWDDGTVHDRRVVAGLNELGIKGTFNLNSGNLGKTNWYGYVSASEIASLYAGHEVAIHTVTHPWLDRLDPAQIASEVLDDRKALEELVGYPVRGMAYPYGTYNQQAIDVLRALGIVYSRTVANQENPWPVREPLAWPATAHMFNTHPLPVGERFKAWHDNLRASGLYYIWGHAYEFEQCKDWPALQRIFQPLAGHADVWYCTNIELFDYEDARKRIVIAANRKTVFNPSALPVTLNIDGQLRDIPAGQTVPLTADH